MKQTVSILITLAGLVFFLTSCEKVVGEGPLRTETRNLSGFTSIDHRISGNVEYRQDSNYKVEITAQQNILDILETYVTSNKLIIRFKNDVRVRNHDDILIKINAPAQKSIRTSGSGNFMSSGPMRTLNLDLELNGSGNIFLEQLHTGNIDAGLSGSGNLTIDNGVAIDEKLRISGSGNIDLADVVADRAITNTSGSGDTRLRVANVLDATISGSGSVYYRGNPIISSRISGSGRIRPF